MTDLQQRDAVRRYFAEVVITGMEFACALCNHIGGCWLSFGGPFKRLHDWAFNTINPMEPAGQRDVGADSTQTQNVAPAPEITGLVGALSVQSGSSRLCGAIPIQRNVDEAL